MKWALRTALMATLTVAAACSSGANSSDQKDQTSNSNEQAAPLVGTNAKVLVLWVTETAGSDLRESGPIPPGLRQTAPLEIGARVLADHLTRCGATRFNVDLSWTHHEYVFVPSTANDLQLVKCVQSKIGFSFWAGIGSPDDPPATDSTRFEALHAQAH